MARSRRRAGKRRDRRKPGRFTATDRVEYAWNGRSTVSVLTNLSTGGMALRRAEHLTLGAVIEFELCLRATETPLTLRGEVVGNSSTETHVQFTGGQESAVADLRQFIEGQVVPALETECAVPHPGAQRLLELGSQYESLGRNEEALALYRRGVVSHPRHLALHEHFARLLIHRAQDEGEGALPTLEELEAIVAAGRVLGHSEFLESVADEIADLQAKLVARDLGAQLADREAALERAQGELRDLAEQHRASHLRISELEEKVAALARGKARARARQEEAAARQQELKSEARRLQEERAQLESERRSLEDLAQSLEERREGLRQQAAEVVEQKEAVDAAYQLLEATTTAASESLGAEEAEVLRGQAWVERERKNLERVRAELDQREAELQEATALLAADATRNHQRPTGGTGRIKELEGASAHPAGESLVARLGILWVSHPWLIILVAVVLAALVTATVVPAWMASAPGEEVPMGVERGEP